MTNEFSKGMELSGEGEDKAIVICNKRFLLRCLPLFMQGFQAVGEDNPYALEKRGRKLVEDGIRPEDVPGFVKDVCAWAWGGDSGTGTLVLARNQHDAIADALNAAVKAVKSKGDITLAIGHIVNLRQSRLSFAARHLRVLFPEKCVACDSISFGDFEECYRDCEGYAAFCSDFAKLAEELNKRGVPNEHRQDGKWLAADAELAVYGKYCHKERCRCDPDDPNRCGEEVK